jgi:predicted nuclease of predicted toxin-antitoxin system
LGGSRQQLEIAGYDVIRSGDWSEDPGDEEILARAYNEGRILVTLDKDFGELAIVRSVPLCGIIRLVNLAVRQQAEVCLQAIALHGQELMSGAIITAEFGRLRIRNLG